MAAIFALPQTTIEVDGTHYLVDAMPASVALEIQEAIFDNDGKITMKLIKRVVCGSVSVDGKAINEKSFDVVFARKTSHLRKLVNEILIWNFEDADFLEESVTEE